MSMNNLSGENEHVSEIDVDAIIEKLLEGKKVENDDESDCEVFIMNKM